MPDDLVAAVEEALSVDPQEFAQQVAEDAERLKEQVTGGQFDNPQALTGLEYEFYSVKDHDAEGSGSLARVPRRLLEFIGFEKELGLHNAEVSTRPLPVNAEGIAAQEAELAAQLRTALNGLSPEGLRIVSDGMWTIPPYGESAISYLTDSVEDKGIRVASNMSDAPRYHAMANAPTHVRPAMQLDAPHVSLEADTVMPESLITSIQPHFQVPRAVNLPMYYRYALRIAGPLTALGANSPLFPPELYDDVPADEILSEAWHANRIRVFESVMNDPTRDVYKVRFPADVETVEEAIDRIVDDPVLVPLQREETGRFDDSFGTLRLKSGTYWRWVRPVFDGATPGAANARIEFRPIAAQPTIRDSIAFQAAFCGLMEALPMLEHPVMELDWTTAEGNFYDAVRYGIAAEQEWITLDGTQTTHPPTMYADLLDQAAEGLRVRGLSEEAIGRYLGPLRRRVRHGTTPAVWKLREVKDRLADGESFEDAIYGMQRTYIAHQRETVFDGTFTDWIETETRYA